ncbi:MAG: sensor histidine kinase [Candidatus Hodarchaeales archaeon]
MEIGQFRSEFVSLTSRELRQVLQIIKGYCEILNTKNDKLTSKERDRCFELLNKNIIRLERFVGSIDEIDGISQDKMKLVVDSVNFTDLIETIFEPYKMTLGKQFEYKIINGNIKNLLVEVDSERIAQALDNIIQNAIDHSSKDHRQITVTCNLADEDVINITISDNGAGIASKNVERVIEPFVSVPSKYSIGGTGIGLYISHTIIKNHNGKISIESAGIGKGTTVKLVIPKS